MPPAVRAAPRYRAPELLLGPPYQDTQGRHVQYMYGPPVVGRAELLCCAAHRRHVEAAAHARSRVPPCTCPAVPPLPSPPPDAIAALPAPQDMWAVGCLMGELLDGEPLFAGDSDLDQLYRVQQVRAPT
jgi:hypothetical protein